MLWIVLRFLQMAQLISFICKRTVVSTKPVQPGKYCPLSVLDRIMEPYHLCIVLYYQPPMRGEVGEVTKKLRESLSEMLSSFPIATGRLVKSPGGHWMIKCNDAGVRMVEASGKGRVEEWLRDVDREKELKLVYWEDMFHKPYFWSTFYVQVTEFEGGGLAIGLSCTHLLSDPTCATMFLKAWADTTIGSKAMISPPLFQPLPPKRPSNKNINHPLYTHLINHYTSSIQKPPPPLLSPRQPHSTVTISFTHQMVKTCMARTTLGGAMEGFSPTPFEALAALFWVCISKVKGKKNGLTNMSICLDMRKVLGLDKGFFGNCMVYNKVHVDDGLEENIGNLFLSKAANAIKGVVGKMDIEGIMDLIEWLECTHNYQSPPLMNGHDLICANLEGVGAYTAMFEDGLKPIRASYYVEPAVGEGVVLILPSPAGEEGSFSRVVMVTLPEEEVVKLCKDDLFMQFSPTILMGVNKI